MRKMSDEFLLQELIRAHKEFGRVPQSYDLSPTNGYPDYTTYNKRFKLPLKDLCKNLGIYDGIDQDHWKNLDSIEKFYTLGVLISDGWVSNSHVFVEVSAKDKDWLLNLRDLLKIKTKVMERDIQGKYTNYRIFQGSVKWVEDLAVYGVIPNKRQREKIPISYISNSDNASAILLGLFDGDGCIHKLKNSNKLIFNYSGNLNLCTQYLSLLKKYADVIGGGITPGNGNTYQLQIAGKDDLYNIYEFLYQNSELSDYWLYRKYKTWEDFYGV